MNHLNKLHEFAVKVAGGSGCLFQPETTEYTYVLTAKHVIKDLVKISITREVNSKPRVQSLVIIGKPYFLDNSDEDAAIIKIKYIKDLSPLYIIDNSNETDIKYYFIGHPGVRRKNKSSYRPDPISEILPRTDGFYEAIVMPVAIQKEIEGKSGGGIIGVKNNEYFLAGIQSNMSANRTRETLGHVDVMPLSVFDKIIERYSEELLPIKSKFIKPPRRSLSSESDDSLSHPNYPSPSKEIAFGKFPDDIKHFTNQVSVLNRLHKMLLKEKAISISGTHGLGKTSLAIRYLYKFREQFEHIIFINASKDRLIPELSKIASSVSPNLIKDVNDKVRALDFGTWLKEKKNCLVIFDNIENFEENIDYIPQYDLGFTIITSNESDVGREWTPVKIDAWKTEDLALLLFRLAKNLPKANYENIPATEKGSLNKIVKELDELPLAIYIAASCIFAAKITFKEYIEELECFRNSYVDEQIYEEGVLKSLKSTFSISINRISEFNPKSDTIDLVPKLATYCLRLSCFLSPVDIPFEIFKKCISRIQSKHTLKNPNINIWRKVSTKLLAYSLFERNNESDTFSTFPSIQKVIRSQLQEKSKEYLELLIDIFDELFIDPTSENKENGQKYNNHLRATLDFLDDYDFEDNDFDPLYLQKISILHFRLGQFELLMKEDQNINIPAQL